MSVATWGLLGAPSSCYTFEVRLLCFSLEYFTRFFLKMAVKDSGKKILNTVNFLFCQKIISPNGRKNMEAIGALCFIGPGDFFMLET